MLRLTSLSAVLLLLGAAAACNSPSSSGGAGATEAPFVPATGPTADPAAASPGATAAAQNASRPAPSGAPTPDSLHLISPGRAGRLRLNMRPEDLQAVVPTTQLRAIPYQEQGRTLPAYELRDAQQPQAPPTLLYFRGDSSSGFRLSRIRILDPQYRTAEGIGVGSPFGAARQNLGLTRLRNTPAGFAAVSGEVKMAWLLDEKSLPAKHAADMNSADIPAAARITGVILYQ